MTGWFSVHLVKSDVESWGDDTTLVETTVEFNDDFAGAVIINNFELSDVTVFHHDLEKFDDDLAKGNFNSLHVNIDVIKNVKKSHQVQTRIFRFSPMPGISPKSFNFHICRQKLKIIRIFSSKYPNLEAGRMRTWRLPRFSALQMFLRASARTFMRTMMIYLNQFLK